jgi:hypothetical protein
MARTNNIIIYLLFILIGLFIVGIARVNAQTEGVQKQDMPILCMPFEVVEKIIAEKLHEQPAWLGRTSSNNFLFLTQNKEAPSWTLFVRLPSGLACVIAAGDKSQFLDVLEDRGEKL